MELNVEKFKRKPRKSLSQKENFDDIISKEKSNKRLSQLNESNKLLLDFYSPDKFKLQSRSSLPLQFPPDNLSNYKNNNLDENNIDKRSSNNSKDLEHSSRDKMSIQNKTKNLFDSFYGGIRDIKVVWKNRQQDKEEEEKEKDQLDKEYEKAENFLNQINEKNKANENIDINFSSSTLGLGGSKKSFMKSEDKNTKINLKNIITNEKINIKSNSASVILSDILHVEKQNNKLHVLINIMEEYKDNISEKMFCKNLQDRLNLNIFICLSKISFKLYNCIENKTKFEKIRKYICSLTDDIKYNLINNPNFTISLINQKLIDIDRLDKSILINNDEDIKINDNNPINSIESSLNVNSRMNKIDFSQNSNSNSNSEQKQNKIKENFFNIDDEEIIYENFEEFNADNGNDNDLYVNPNFFYDVDNKDNNVNTLEHNAEPHKQSVIENNLIHPPRSPKKKTRRNATHRISVNKYQTKANNNNQKHYFNPNNYNFQIIDINGQVDDNEFSEDSFDSEQEIIEVTENSKLEKQKLIFFEDYLRDKEKRRLIKVDQLQLDADKKFLENRERLIEINKLAYKNIIDIVKDNTSLLPNYKLNLDPKELANEINEIGKYVAEKKSFSSKDKEENKDNIFFYSNDSSDEEKDSKDNKRFDINSINDDENDNDINLN